MSRPASRAAPLAFAPVRRPDGVTIEQALARNNSWYVVVYGNDNRCELRYASQSGNLVLGTGLTPEEAHAQAEAHASRYDTRV